MIKWTHEEVEKAYKLHREGFPLRVVGLKVGRTEEAVKAKLKSEYGIHRFNKYGKYHKCLVTHPRDGNDMQMEEWVIGPNGQYFGVHHPHFEDYNPPIIYSELILPVRFDTEIVNRNEERAINIRLEDDDDGEGSD